MHICIASNRLIGQSSDETSVCKHTTSYNRTAKRSVEFHDPIALTLETNTIRLRVRKCTLRYVFSYHSHVAK
jgi:hypothetical protein